MRLIMSLIMSGKKLKRINKIGGNMFSIDKKKIIRKFPEFIGECSYEELLDLKERLEKEIFLEELVRGYNDYI